MKHIINFSLSLFLLAAFHTARAQKENQERIDGNGHLVTKEIAVQPFTTLDASGLYELKLTQGTKEGVTIEADENLQPYFTVRNEGTKLILDTKGLNNKSLHTKNKMRVSVTFKTLKALDLRTVGNVSSTNNLSFDDLEFNNNSVGNIDLNLNANTLNLENTSVGNVTLSGKAENAVVKNSGVGSLKAGSFVVQTLDIENTGVGSAEVNAAKGLKVNDSFLGKVKNKGTAPVRKRNKVVI